MDISKKLEHRIRILKHMFPNAYREVDGCYVAVLTGAYTQEDLVVISDILVEANRKWHDQIDKDMAEYKVHEAEIDEIKKLEGVDFDGHTFVKLSDHIDSSRPSIFAIHGEGLRPSPIWSTEEVVAMAARQALHSAPDWNYFFSTWQEVYD